MSKGRGNAEACRVEDCAKPAHGASLCRTHYQRWKRSGSTEGKTQSICDVCGISFTHEPTKGRRAYCSETCYVENRRRIYAAYNADNREKRAAYDRARVRVRRRDYAKLLEYNRQRRVRLRAGLVVRFSSGQLAQRLSMFGGCWICGDAATQVDHVKPIARGGPHMLANLRPICGSCNARKHARWPLTTRDLAVIGIGN